MHVVLKKGKERAVHLGHHWIFSGAIEKAQADDGSIIAVKNSKGETLGYGYYNSKSQIRIRMLTFGDIPFTCDILRTLITQSFERRKALTKSEISNAWRMIFSEGDFLPGLIIDTYAGHFIIQCLTLGIEALKNDIVDILRETQSPLSIYERSDYPGRKLEGLPDMSGQLFGTTPDEIIIHELGVTYPIDVKGGQKTGFFLDQRENRALIQKLAHDKTILNLFSYTGGFTMAAAAGGASSSISVDISAKASHEAESIYSLNSFSVPSTFITQDAFDYVRTHALDQDIIIVDPPAFAKTRNDIDQACRGYKDINMNVFKRAKKGAFILTCSCSRFIDADLFQKVIFGAVTDAGRQVQIIRRTGHPADHPVNIAVPETEYLKGLLMYIV